MNAWASAERRLSAGSPPERAQILRRWLRASADAAGAEIREGAPDPASDLDYPAMFERTVERVAGTCASTRAERESAPAALRRLLELPAGEREDAVRGDPEFQTWSLTRLLGQASSRASHDDPAEAVSLARLGLAAAEQVPDLDAGLRNDLLTACHAYVGNAQRSASDFDGAARSFAAAETCYARSIGDPTRLGFLRGMQASLLADRSDFSSALTYARRARRAFREAGDATFHARAALQEAHLLYHLGRSDEAARLLESTSETVERASDRRLHFALHANWAAYLVDLERFDDARRSVSRARALLPYVSGRLDRIQLAWIEAELDAATGHDYAAELRFRHVRDTFLAAGASHEFAIVTLELALLLARGGRFAEAKQAAREAIPILQSLGIGPEAILAVRLYAEASFAEAAQATALADLVRKLKRWKPSPGGG